MTLSKLMLSFGTLALAVASAAASYSVTLTSPSFVAGTELKPGNYKVELDGNKARFKAGKNVVEAAVTVKEGDQRFDTTSLQYGNSDGKYRLEAIRLGGTKTTLVFSN